MTGLGLASISHDCQGLPLPDTNSPFWPLSYAKIQSINVISPNYSWETFSASFSTSSQQFCRFRASLNMYSSQINGTPKWTCHMVISSLHIVSLLMSLAGFLKFFTLKCQQLCGVKEEVELHQIYFDHNLQMTSKMPPTSPYLSSSFPLNC